MQANTKESGGKAVSVGIKLLRLPFIWAVDAVLDAVAKHRWERTSRWLPRRLEHWRIVLCQCQL